MNMKDYDSQMIGNLGAYVDERNTFSFQMGSNPSGAIDPGFENDLSMIGTPQSWFSVNGYQIAARGSNNTLVEETERDIEANRLLPRLYNKQMIMLYGNGPMLYKTSIENNKVVKQWIDNKEVTSYFDRWMLNGMEQSFTDFCKSNAKNYYYFRDFYSKVRMSMGSAIGKKPIAGLEAMENKDCRLCTSRMDVATNLIKYSDLRQVAVGSWLYGGSNFQIYPRFDIRQLSNYNFAAISHHREKSVGDFYGNNETHQGTKSYIRGANQNADYINSFLKNSLAAKLHIIIPDSWMEQKRKQITALCNENKKRAAQTPPLAAVKYNDIEIGTDFRESSLIQYVNQELRKLSAYLSGSENQGKAWATYSHREGQNKEEDRWRIENVDLKYKEYIEALISYDKRADEVITTSVGLDASVSGISKDGIISKSGSDLYYNYLIYLISLTHDDEKVCEPLNQICLQGNFPQLYAEGYRIGFYREIPSRQEDVSPTNRINQQQP